MNILLVYQKCPDSFWSFNHALKFISKITTVFPLKLITVSAILSAIYEKKQIELNITSLNSEDVWWADYVLFSTIYIQIETVKKVIAVNKIWNTKIVVGGSFFIQDFHDYPEIDHFVLNKVEITLSFFLNELSTGNQPVPDFHLLSVKIYAFMNIPDTRNFPFVCKFCVKTSPPGHKVMMKSNDRFLSEQNVL